MNNLYDLFKANNYIERECATVVKQPVMLSAEEENRLENARRLDNMFGASRVVSSVSQDNNVAVDVNLEYGNKGNYNYQHKLHIYPQISCISNAL